MMDSHRQEEEEVATLSSDCPEAQAETTRAMAADYNARVMEIDRRSSLKQQYDEAKKQRSSNGSRSGSGSSGSSSFMISAFNLVLINKANVGLNPHSDVPAFRALGYFKSVDEIKMHLASLREQGIDLTKGGDLHACPVGKWALISRNKARDADEQYVLNKIQAHVDLHLKERDAANKQFASRVNSGGSGEDSGAAAAAAVSSLEKQRERQQNIARKKKEKSNAASKKKTKKDLALMSMKSAADKQQEEKQLALSVPRAAELRGQQCAVVSIMKDYSKPVMKLKDVSEPAVMFLDVFNSPEDAQKAIELRFQEHIRDFNLDVVSLYEWVRPDNMNPEQLPPEAEVWRSKEQTDIMSSRKKERLAAQKGISQCESADPSKITDVVSNPSMAESDYMSFEHAPGGDGSNATWGGGDSI